MAHILGPQPTWPCLINGLEKGHMLPRVQHVVHGPISVSVRIVFHHFFDIRYDVHDSGLSTVLFFFIMGFKQDTFSSEEKDFF